jgi:farnesyl diphosphate synthase
MAAERPGAQLDLAQITALQQGKTGALFEWSAAAGARMAAADPAPLIRYAAALGQAFQIHDDVIDVTGDAAAAAPRTSRIGRCRWRRNGRRRHVRTRRN